jgi:ADP-ribosyl-[dinitrogen reductase] hydrolase
MVQDALLGADKNHLLHQHAHRLVEQFPQFKFRAVRQSQNPSGYIVDTIQAVFQSFFDTDDFRSCLIDVVNRGGDADTTGAIAGMLAGALYGLKSIPEAWVMTLDTQIRRGCEAQAQSLLQLSTPLIDASLNVH